MSRWQDLYSEVTTRRSAGLERDARQEALWDWAVQAADSLMMDLAEQAGQRGLEVEDHTGVPVSVTGPTLMESLGSTARVSVLDLRQPDRQLCLYTHVEPGSLPVLVYLLQGETGYRHRRARHARLLSLPAARLRPSPSGEALLWPATSPPGMGAGSPLTIDDVLFRAFELLLLGPSNPRIDRAKLARGFRALTPQPGAWLPRD